MSRWLRIKSEISLSHSAQSSVKRHRSHYRRGARKCNFSGHYKKRTIYSGVLLGRRWWSVLTDGERTRSADGRTSRADVYQQQARADLCSAVKAPRRLKERLLTWLMTTPLLLLSLMSFAWISHCWLIVHPPRMRLVHNVFGLLKLAVSSRPKYHSCTESEEIQKCNFVIFEK